MAVVGELDDAAPAVGRIDGLYHQPPGLQAVEQDGKSRAVHLCKNAQLGLVERAALAKQQKHGKLRISQIRNPVKPERRPRLRRPAQLVGQGIVPRSHRWPLLRFRHAMSIVRVRIIRVLNVVFGGSVTELLVDRRDDDGA